MRRSTLLVAVGALALVGTACGGGGWEHGRRHASGVGGDPGRVSSVEAGEVTFEATNESPDDPHELVVVRTDLSPEALPRTPTAR